MGGVDRIPKHGTNDSDSGGNLTTPFEIREALQKLVGINTERVHANSGMVQRRGHRGTAQICGPSEGPSGGSYGVRDVDPGRGS